MTDLGGARCGCYNASMTIPDPATEAAEFLSLVRDELGPTLHRSTVPILSQRDGGRAGATVVAASGILIAVDDARFLVTAAHVLALKRVHGAVLCVPTSPGVCEDLGGEIAYPTPPLDDAADIGVLRLTVAMAKKIESLGAVFLRLAVAEPVDPARLPDGGYVVYGYPSDGAATGRDGEIKPIPHYLGCIPYRGDTTIFDKYDPECQALLSLRRHEVRNQHTGQFESFPEPHGMSGCGVWWAYAPRDATNGWKPEYARLVGIQSAWYDDSALVFIPIQVARDLIARGWPDLSPAVGIAAPPRP